MLFGLYMLAEKDTTGFVCI